jgi:hypothetical protein
MLGLGLPEEALVSCRRAVELADRLRQAVLQWPALDGLATSLKRLGREEEGEIARRRAREVIAGVAAGLAPERSALFLNSPTVVGVLQVEQ